MNKEVRRALEAVAKAAGLTITEECTYCGQSSHSECDDELHIILTFVGPSPKEDEDEDE